jgi:hypothetical protein
MSEHENLDRVGRERDHAAAQHGLAASTPVRARAEK